MCIRDSTTTTNRITRTTLRVVLVLLGVVLAVLEVVLVVLEVILVFLGVVPAVLEVTGRQAAPTQADPTVPSLKGGNEEVPEPHKDHLHCPTLPHT